MKKWLVYCAVLLCVCFGFEFTAAFALFRETSGKLKPIYAVDTQEKIVAFSFDAAYGADRTKDIMDILESHNAGATFFLVGFWIDKFPEKVKEIASRGFEIGNHSKNHLNMGSLDRERQADEIRYVNERIRALTGREPELFRPPYGDYSDSLVTTVREMGMHAVQWTVDSLDWKEYGREEEIKRVLDNVKPGAIVLFHNQARFTPEALDPILTALEKEEYRIVPVGELILHESYRVDVQGVQHSE